MTEALRPWRAQLDDRDRPRVPLSLLRIAYQMAVDTQAANASEPETARDYWPTCVEMVLIDHGLLDPADARLT